MAKIGVPSNEKIFKAVQDILGKKIPLPKGVFFVPFRGHELVIARVEEIISLTSRGLLDIAFVTQDHYYESREISMLRDVRSSSDLCHCDLSIITAEEGFSNRDSVEIFSEFYEKNGRKAVLATRFPKLTFEFLWITKYFRARHGWKEIPDRAFPIIKEVKGSGELSILLNATDFTVARVESGRTLKLNRLFPVEKIFSSCLIMVRHQYFLSEGAEEVLSALKPKFLKPPPECVYMDRGSESIH